MTGVKTVTGVKENALNNFFVETAAGKQVPRGEFWQPEIVDEVCTYRRS